MIPHSFKHTYLATCLSLMALFFPHTSYSSDITLEQSTQAKPTASPEKPSPPKTTPAPDATTSTPATTKVLLTTNKGEIVFELEPTKAPISVANFLEYVDAGFYNNTTFHRVIKGFMIQGGGFDLSFKKKSTRTAIKNEAKNGLKNIRGSIAMARTQVVDSATSQFFINLDDNSFLDHGVRDFGYAVFGQVIKGMDIVDQIAATPTTVKHRMRDVPETALFIKEAKRL